MDRIVVTYSPEETRMYWNIMLQSMENIANFIDNPKNEHFEVLARTSLIGIYNAMLKLLPSLEASEGSEYGIENIDINEVTKSAIERVLDGTKMPKV